MPYQSSPWLPGERASKLGHLEVINSELVNQLVAQFETPHTEAEIPAINWEPCPTGAAELPLVFAVDGSLQIVSSEGHPPREVSFVKTALLRLDQFAMEKVNQDTPHPMALRDLMKEAALYHATALPLRCVSVPGLSNYDTVRSIIYQSLQDKSLNAEPFKTLKWLAYEKWTATERRSPNFECPHCGENIDGLPYDSDYDYCPRCGGQVYLTDMIGFHLEMNEEAASQSVASAYMMIHEILLLFTGIRHFWGRNRQVLSSCLFMKDGPLTLRSQYSKLVIPIRHFFEFAKKEGVPVHVCGQEKTGAFVDHLTEIVPYAPDMSYFLPSNDYIRREVQRAPERSEPYGSRTNYGNKLFFKAGAHSAYVLSIPVGEYKDSESIDDLIGAKRILASLVRLKSHLHENALLPIQLANGVASLSSYPSAQVLRVFAGLE